MLAQRNPIAPVASRRTTRELDYGSIQVSRSPFRGDFGLVGDRAQREGGGYRLEGGDVDPAGIANIERSCGEAKRFGDGFDLFETASGQDRVCAPSCRLFRDQLAGVAGRAVDQDCAAKTVGLPSNKEQDATTASGGHSVAMAAAFRVLGTACAPGM